MATVWEYRRKVENPANHMDGLICWIQKRPTYCDRGHWHGVIEAPHWKSDADPAPRYYFDIERAKAEMLDYCRSKKVDITGAEWVLNETEPDWRELLIDSLAGEQKEIMELERRDQDGSGNPEKGGCENMDH